MPVLALLVAACQATAATPAPTIPLPSRTPAATSAPTATSTSAPTTAPTVTPVPSSGGPSAAPSALGVGPPGRPLAVSTGSRAARQSSAPRSRSRSTTRTRPATRSRSRSSGCPRRATGSARCSSTRAVRAHRASTSSVTTRTAIFSPDLQERFDIVGFDPRGVGASTAIECVDDATLDRLNANDPTPDDAAERDALIDGCGGVRVGLRARERQPAAAHDHRGRGARHGGDPQGARRGQALVPGLLVRHLPRRRVRAPVPRPRARVRPRRRGRPDPGLRREPRDPGQGLRRRAGPVPRQLRGPSDVPVQSAVGTCARRSTR